MDNITLIIGAGANKEINPTIGLGIDLVKDISNRVTDRTSPNDPYLSSLLEKELGIDSLTRNSFQIFLDRYINSVKSPSIDTFLDEVSSFPEFKSNNDYFLTIGRFLIIAHILGYEGTTTKEAIKNEINKKRTWLSVVGDFIEKNHLLDETSFKIITFNYDRIVEFFLAARFGEGIKEFIEKNIIHVYGRIGCFKGIPPKENEQEIEFGLDNNRIELITEIQNNIKLIHDRNDTNDIKNVVQKSKKILVFGYGLDPINNTRLGLHKCADLDENFCFNIYPEPCPNFNFRNRRQTSEKVRSLVVNADIHYKTCADFVRKCLL